MAPNATDKTKTTKNDTKDLTSDGRSENADLFLFDANNTSEIQALRKRYTMLINVDLPTRAKKHRWEVHLNHCFARIVLDNLFGRCWYEALGKSSKAAYLRLNENQLREAIHIAESLGENLPILNARSLAWRGKTKDTRGMHP